jgi:hypothetical protein
MAGQSDVQNQLVAQAAAIIYPNGTAQASICGMPVKIYPGWPVPNVLEKDLAAGKVHLSIYPGNTERKTTRGLGRPWIVLSPPVHTIVMTVSGAHITLSGTPSRQNLAVNVNGTTHIYAMQASDTLISAATALSALIPGASSAGSVITVAGAHGVWARVGGFGAAYMETKRQEKQFQIIAWAPTPEARNAVIEALDGAFSESTDMSMADGSSAIIRYSHSFQSDQVEKAGLYRGDLFYSIDYATTKTQQATEVIAPVLDVINALTGATETTLNP